MYLQILNEFSLILWEQTLRNPFVAIQMKWITKAITHTFTNKGKLIRGEFAHWYANFLPKNCANAGRKGQKSSWTVGSNIPNKELCGSEKSLKIKDT